MEHQIIIDTFETYQAPTKLQGQKRKKRTTTPGTQSSRTREEPLPKKHTLETVYWAKSMLNQPPQYILNAKDDYTRTLKKQYEKRRDVPQLGPHAKLSISPLQVSSEVPQGLDMDEAVRLAAQMNITVAELLGGA
jgi:hypothetical protein